MLADAPCRLNTGWGATVTVVELVLLAAQLVALGVAVRATEKLLVGQPEGDRVQLTLTVLLEATAGIQSAQDGQQGTTQGVGMRGHMCCYVLAACAATTYRAVATAAAALHCRLWPSQHPLSEPPSRNAISDLPLVVAGVVVHVTATGLVTCKSRPALAEVATV